MSMLPDWVQPGSSANIAEIQRQIEPLRPADSIKAHVPETYDVGGRSNYALFAIMADGSQGMVPCSGLSWEEQTGELAVRITAKLPDDELEDGRRLPDMITLGSQVAVLAAIDKEPWQEVARGEVEELSPNDGTGGTFEILAYDPIRRLLKSKIDGFYEAGLTPAQVIRRVCSDNGIPVGEINPSLDGTTFPGPSVFHGQTLADVVKNCVTEGQTLSDDIERMVIRTRGGKLEVAMIGNNQPVYWLLQGSNVVSVRQRISITDLVTQVVVTGKSPEAETKPPVITTLTGNLAATHGVRQDILSITSHVSVEEVKAKALDVLKQKGQPRNDRSIVAPDVPSIRKFDQIRVTAGALDGYFSVESITHDEESRTMTIGLGNLEETPMMGVFADGLGKEIDESAIPAPSAVGGSLGDSSGYTSMGSVGGNPALQKEMDKYMGVPYDYGGNSLSGIDCSGFTKNVYAAIGKNIPRTAQTQYNAATPTSSPQFGDLVFFENTYNSPDRITHVGIYVGNGEMVNAQEPYVKRASINTGYWGSKFAGFGRI